MNTKVGLFRPLFIMKTITLHSYKGGTGRTTLCANIAATLAQKGHSVVVLDMDCWSPTLHTIFRVESPCSYIHQYLSGEVGHKELLIDLTTDLGVKGRLSIGVADSSIDVIRSNLTQDRKWHKQSLSRILKLKDTLRNEGFEYVLLDASSGVHPATVNTIVASDFVLVLCKVDNFDMDGTLQLRDVIYDRLDKGTAYLFNKVPAAMLDSNMKKDVTETALNTFGSDAVILGYLEYYPEVPMAMGVEIHALTSPDTEFASELRMIVNQLQSSIE